MTASSLEIRTDTAVTAVALLSRHRGRLMMTVVVKATFDFVPDGMVSPAPPGELVREDRPFEGNPTRSVEFASELAPFLARCDVLFTGHAHAPTSGPVAGGAVRLALFRDSKALLDKTLHVFGDTKDGARVPFTKLPIVYERARGGPGVAANPVGTERPTVVDPRDAELPAGLGPVSPFWPVRKRVLGTLPRKELTAPIAELPENMPWDYFQAAPPDQQLEYLRGGEWLLLDGLNASRARVMTQLPTARAVAILGTRATNVRPVPIELVADMLIIDGDREQCSVLWRGRHELAGSEASLEDHFVAAALATPERGVDWSVVITAASAVSTTARGSRVAPAPDPETTLTTPEGTLDLDEKVVAAIAARPVAPFELGAPRAPGSTSATPWAGKPLTRAPEVVVGESTMTLGPAVVAPPPKPPPIPPPAFVAPPPPDRLEPPRASPPPAPRPPPPTAKAPRPIVKVPAPAAKEAPPPKVPAARPPVDPAALAAKLQGAGASASDLAQLMRALSPPPPPPDDDD